jgi:hypothetical protein
MSFFKVLQRMSNPDDPDEQPMKDAQENASRNYADVSQARHDDSNLETQLAKPLILPSEPNLDIAHSSPGVRQLSDEEVRELLRQNMR